VYKKNTRRIDPRYFMDEKTETINEAWDSAGNWKSRYSDGRSKRQDVEPETDEERKYRREKEERRRREREDLGYPPEKSKYFEENETPYEPGRAVADIDTGEAHVSPEHLEREEMLELADKFKVGIEFDISDFRDGSSYAKVTLEDGAVMYYYDSEEMYQDLAKYYEMNEARLPAWERPGNATPPDDVEVMIPGYGSMMIGQIKRKLAQMLQEAAEDAAKDPPQYSHLDSGVIQALRKALKDNDAL
tara:strand:- start:151 stop:888 length:738 start_codon:yes stop_codon:yes gene_type:complete